MQNSWIFILMFFFAGTTFLVLYRSQEVPRFLSQPLSYIFFGFLGFFAPLGPPPFSEGAISWTVDKVFELFKSLKWFLLTRYEDDMVVGGQFWGNFGDFGVIFCHFRVIFDWKLNMEVIQRPTIVLLGWKLIF